MALFPRPAAPASLVADLTRIVGADAVSVGDADRLAYGQDAWVRDLLLRRAGEVPAAPEAVVWPGSADEVARVLRLLARLGVPVVPFGSGSGWWGGARPSSGGVVLALGRLQAVRTLSPRDLRVEVEAGIVGARLEALLQREGLTLGHFPTSIRTSTLGGWLASRSAGHLSSRYGTIGDMTLGVEAATARGLHRQPGRARPGPGPDWAALSLGGEGCFGVLTAAELRVRPLPEARHVEAWRFRTVPAGVEAMRRVLRAGLRPAVIRLYDALDTLLGRGGRGDAGETLEATGVELGRSILPTWLTGQGWLAEAGEWARKGVVRRSTRAVLGAPRLLNLALDALPEEGLLILGFEGPPSVVRAERAAARAILEGEGADDLGSEPGEHWFRHRFDVPFRHAELLASGLLLDVMNVAATWDRVLPLHRAVRRAIARDAVVMAHFAHGTRHGCGIEFTFIVSGGSPGDPEEALERHGRVGRAARVAVHEMGGTVSHHGGVGEAHAEAVARELGAGGLRLLSAVATAVDPARVLNPGKLGLTRYAPPRPRRTPATGGLPRAVAAAVGEQNLLVRDGRTLVRPPDERALAALVRVAHGLGLTLVSDQTVRLPPSEAAVHVDLARLEGITRISEHACFVECEAGVRVDRLESTVRGSGLTLGSLHPLAAELTVGAALARNRLVRRSVGLGGLGGGALSVRALLAAGEAVETRSVPRASVGPALAHAFIGAGGRFGIITRAVLRIAPVPTHAVELRYELPSFEAAVAVAREGLWLGLAPDAARAWPKGEGGAIAWALSAPSESALAARAATFIEAAERAGGRRRPPGSEVSEGGRFDAVLEVATRWGNALRLARGLQGAIWSELWLDFMTPEEVTVVVRIEDPSARNEAREVARALEGRILDEDEPAPDDGFEPIAGALDELLDPRGVD